eukprot:TRINITY_DN18773_c2_g1_i2.p4 TRINITY_DN18773_c2_g1~~TRINITY_DN18773_c2_g1_i2.p4  ORF type:complete len:106 (+),score=38.95 TRINITY_DN18773_c2_g1_i2:23-340(+)
MRRGERRSGRSLMKEADSVAAPALREDLCASESLALACSSVALSPSLPEVAAELLQLLAPTVATAPAFRQLRNQHTVFLKLFARTGVPPSPLLRRNAAALGVTID